MPIDPQQHARTKREQRMRRRLLTTLYGARGSDHDGWQTGRFVVDVINYVAPPMEKLDDASAQSLLRDLVAKGYAEDRDDRLRESDPHGLDYRSYRITGRGVSLIDQTIPRDPDIQDDRIK